MKCGKVVFNSRQEAKNTLRQLNKTFKRQGKHVLKHVYWCPDCYGYHTTSMDHEKSRKSAEIKKRVVNSITPQIKKELKLIATNLPTVFVECVEYHNMTGRQIKTELEIMQDQHGKPLVDDIIYQWPYPVQMARNHYRHLTKAFQRGGEPEVIKYIREVKSLPAA
jgi:hypothetical protein